MEAEPLHVEARIARNKAELQKLEVEKAKQKLMVATALTGLATTAAAAAAVAEKEKEVEASSTLDNGARASVAHHKYYGEREDPALTKMLHARSTSDTDLSTEGANALADGPKSW